VLGEAAADGPDGAESEEAGADDPDEVAPIVVGCGPCSISLSDPCPDPKHRDPQITATAAEEEEAATKAIPEALAPSGEMHPLLPNMAPILKNPQQPARKQTVINPAFGPLGYVCGPVSVGLGSLLACIKNNKKLVIKSI